MVRLFEGPGIRQTEDGPTYLIDIVGWTIGVVGAMRNTIRKFVETLGSYNLDQVIGAISWRLPGWFFNYARAYLMLSIEPKLDHRQFTAYFLRLATTDDISLIERIGIPGSLTKERLANGDRCVIIGKDQEVLSIIWGATGKRYLKISGAILDTGEDGVIFYGGETKESARLKGFFPTTFHELYRSYARENRIRVFASVHSLNTASLKMHLRMNFISVGETVHISLAGINVTYYRKWPQGCKRWHIFLKKPPQGLFWN